MLHKLTEWAKEHPYMAGGIVVGLVVLIYLVFFRRSSVQASPADSTLANYYAAEAASIQTAGQVQQAQLGYTAATNQTNASADVAKAYIGFQQDVSNNYINALKQMFLANNKSNEDLGIAAVGAHKADTAAALKLGLAQTAFETSNSNNMLSAVEATVAGNNVLSYNSAASANYAAELAALGKSGGSYAVPLTQIYPISGSSGQPYPSIPFVK